jgi:hypothetical protein
VISKLPAFGYQRPGAHETAGANASPIQDGRTHSDEGPFANLASVQDCVMPDCYVLIDNEWEAGIGMQHRPSCMLLRAPILIASLLPRRTAPNQMPSSRA